MKKAILLTVLIGCTFFCQGQVIKRITERAKQRAESKTNEKVDTKVDNTIDSAFSKTDKAVNESVKGNPADKQNKEDKNISPQTKTESETTAVSPIKAYSKYDFVPGEKIIGYEDFMTGTIGDFPSGWNTNSSAEIVTIENKPGRWLMLTKPGVFVPEITNNYPDDFTFEFDLLHGIPINGAYFNIALAELENIQQPQNWTLATNRINFELDNANTGTTTGTSKYSLRKNSISEPANFAYSEILNDQNNPVHISIWRQKERVRLYINQEKMWDLPKALAPGAKLNSIVFDVPYAESGLQHYIGNLRLAIGAPDTRNKILTEKKWVTHGILFDVNSDQVKPQSYGSLKEIANVLKENADLKVKIIGHTDADGNDAANLDLSKRRAAAVKATLVKDFGIAENRMDTDGKGESEPVDKNDTPAGKANNRRVEFIRL